MLSRKTLLLVSAIAAAVVLVAVACSDGGDEGDSNSVPPFPTSSEAGISASDLLSLSAFAMSGQVGISVSGIGSVSAAPDTAIVTLGVQARRDTVALARNDAARAMTAISDVLQENGVDEEDIRTSYLSIHPVYDYRNDQRELEGFEVSNTAVVKVRDLDKVDDIIDGAVKAGGDLTRVQGIGFTVDDPTPFLIQARQEAVTNAVTRATQLADLLGLTLGNPISVVEGGGGVPVFADGGIRNSFLDQAAAPPTPISPGETEILSSVSIVFAIE